MNFSTSSMRFVLFSITFTVSFISLEAQDTTLVYFTRDWKLTDQSGAVFYRKKFLQSGLWIARDYFVSTNVLQMEGSFSDPDGKFRVGVFKYYQPDGTMTRSEKYDNNRLVHVGYYFPSGKLKAEVFYGDNGLVLSQAGYDEEGHVVPGMVVSRPAAFVGGAGAWQEFLQKQLSLGLPRDYRKGKMSGEVVVEFVINKEGRVDQVRVLQSSGFPELDEHAMNIIKKTEWIPAIQLDKPVLYRQRQRITYEKYGQGG